MVLLQNKALPDPGHPSKASYVIFPLTSSFILPFFRHFKVVILLLNFYLIMSHVLPVLAIFSSNSIESTFNFSLFPNPRCSLISASGSCVKHDSLHHSLVALRFSSHVFQTTTFPSRRINQSPVYYL